LENLKNTQDFKSSNNSKNEIYLIKEEIKEYEKNYEKSKSPKYLPDSQTYLAYIKKPLESEYSSIINQELIRTILKSP
jgi:hypothetical protein